MAKQLGHILKKKPSIPLKEKIQQTLTTWFTNQFLLSKLNTPFGYITGALLAVGIAFLVATFGMKAGAGVLIVMIGLPFLLACLGNLKLGVAFIIIISFFLLGIKKYLPVELPLGILVDLLIFLMLFGLFIRKVRTREKMNTLSNIVSLGVIVWIGYSLICVFNPIAASRLAWFYTVRGMAGLTCVYFIALYVFSDVKYIMWITKLLVFLSLLAALYAFKQEYIGLSDAELRWLHADEARYKLIFQWGRIRKFSFLSDPTTFGILMAYMGVFTFILSVGPFKMGQKIILLISSILMFIAMVFSGTRTGFVLVPIGIVFWTMLTLQRTMVIATVCFLLLGTVVIMIPTSNADLYRIQSAFKPKKDASLQLRLDNQAFIQPFIQKNPMGGGLGSTGVWGKRFSPNSPLSNFPPDSGYVRTAVEQGWIGILLYCTLLGIILTVGIRKYVYTQNPKFRSLYVAFLTLLFLLVVANYPQEAIILLPNSIIFYITMAILVRLNDFDTPESTMELSK